MKKTTIILLVIFMALIGNVCYGKEIPKETTRNEITDKKVDITQREATISMLLDTGWTMQEIEECYTEELLLELDQNCISVSGDTKYIVNYENDEGKIESKEISRQECDYYANKKRYEQNKYENSLSSISSNGILELQPIFDWESTNHITDNTTIHFINDGAYSGASIWNATSTCYLKQQMGLLWLGNEKYKVQYRFEWMTEPLNKLTDHFAVGLATDLIVYYPANCYLTFKYTLGGSDYTERITPNADTTYTTGGTYWCRVQNLSFGQGRQVKINWPSLPNTKGDNLRGFISFDCEVETYGYDNFIVYAQYYHGKVSVNPNASIGASANGVSLSFSISPSYNYTAEDNSMEVRARNYYKS